MACDYPIFLDLKDKAVVVIGGGNVAARKVDRLLAAGARVRVVARELHDRLESLVGSRLDVVRANFVEEHLNGAFLVFACTNSAEVNAHVAAAARRRGQLVSRADEPGDCDFIVPSVSDHESIKLAVSTGGGSPAMAKFVRRWLDENLPRELADLAYEVSLARDSLLERVRQPEDRAAAWQTLCSEQSASILRDEGADAWHRWCGEVIGSHVK